ncbi:MAG: PhoH family protein, partial [Thermodesulfovibrionales bacterium]|nr:PhoH family protein [Thermodesulfovibrionales bacterium]
VITGSTVDKPYLSKEEYLNLGIKQSIYLNNERELVYTLFEKYTEFLKENGYYDPNILAHNYLAYVKPIYDFVVVDEVQDITNIQLQLILKSLKDPHNFIFCGDSNQIVHPNFFSWSGLKSMLYKSEDLETKKITRLLQSNYRNSMAITLTSNLLVKIKQKRFGSIDRESSYLMNSVSEDAGEIVFLKDTDKIKSELNKNIRRSTKFALIVMRDEDKPDARKYFDTPLLFSIYEAKGLEYENVVLLNFISKERQNFIDIVNGITNEDLQEELRYMRASDKSDKSLETYKFYINSLYVAFTRAVKSLYLIENDTQHPLLHLIGLKNPLDTLQLKVEQSSKEDWHAEALRLQLQGKQEQADEIRKTILKTQPVPWEVYNQDKISSPVKQILTAKDNPQKPRKLLFDYALFYDSRRIIEFLARNNFDKAKQIFSIISNIPSFNQNLYLQHQTNLNVRYLQKYLGNYYQDILKQCEIYGVDHRTEFNFTPLMLSAWVGNLNLIKELLDLGADITIVNNFGLTSWHIALYKILIDGKITATVFAQIHDLIAPTSLSLKVDNKLIKIDSKSGEFLLLHIFILMTLHNYNWMPFDLFYINAVGLAERYKELPDTVVPEYRKKRQYISSLLSKNEVDIATQNSKKLFKRIRRGWYILNPSIQIKYKDEWHDIYRFIGLEFLSTIHPDNKNGDPSFIYEIISNMCRKEDKSSTEDMIEEVIVEETNESKTSTPAKPTSKKKEVMKESKVSRLSKLEF